MLDASETSINLLVLISGKCVMGMFVRLSRSALKMLITLNGR